MSPAVAKLEGRREEESILPHKNTKSKAQNVNECFHIGSET